MDRYQLATSLLGLWDEKTWMPIFRGPRYRRYQSIDKMMDLIEIAGKSAPVFPVEAVLLNPMDDEWDDQMTYININYGWIWSHIFVHLGLPLSVYIYNHNLIHYNVHYRALKWFLPLVMVWQFEKCYKYYRTQLTKGILFDEYVQARADELIAQREHLLHTDQVKRYLNWQIDYKETLNTIKREQTNNHASDFKQAELALQAFINRWVDPAVGIKYPLAGPRYQWGGF
ncbi:unnamed protein product [Blepharisma stoltei]|uniref:Uncharacterized protein n=1 Tax=Blepharisma stoltei TaxID=1481888 RepID=A0AAU9JU71_9CILI|nr:unnamed protein product [Blepharisma stoltei]